MSFEASSSVSPKAVAPSATPWTGAWLFSKASKSLAEIRFGNSMSSISSRWVRRARAPCDKVCVTKIFFLLVDIVPTCASFLAGRHNTAQETRAGRDDVDQQEE